MSVKLSATPTSLEDGETITLKAEASGGQGSLKVEFYKSGEKVGEDALAPFELSLPIVANDDATLGFTAKVIAADGQSAISDAVSVSVKVDKEAPKISLAASNSNLNAAGAVTLSANATDNKGVVKVEFFKGTEKLGEDTTAEGGFSLVVNLTDADNGSLKYTAKAYDKKGNVGISAEVRVSVDIDTAPPTISLSADKTKVTSTSSVTLTANASDNKGIGKVEFYEGENKLAEDSEEPFTHQIGFTAASNGNHSYTAKAFDAAGNSAVSSEVAITVDIDATLPVVSLSSDTSRISKAGSAVLTANASDDKGISKVEFYQGANKLSEDTQAPFEHVLNFAATEANNGNHIYTAKAYDDNSNSAESDPVGISVDIDLSKPTITLGASPNSLNTAGTLTLSATATDNKGVVKVEFYKNGQKLGEDTNSDGGFGFAVDYTINYKATDSFMAIAFDAAGNQATSNTLDIPIDIDITAPTVSLIWSVDKITETGGLKFTTTSNDNVAVTKLEIYWVKAAGNVLIDTINNPPPIEETFISFGGEENGTITFFAKAYDAKNNVTTSAPANLLVEIKPSITAFGTAAGSSLSLSDAGGTVNLFWEGESVESFTLSVNPAVTITDTGIDSAAITLPVNPTNQAKVYTLTLNAKAFGNLGIPDDSKTLNITVAGDTTPPAFTSFSASSYDVGKEGSIILSAVVSDTNGIAKVEFWEGNKLLAFDDNASGGYTHTIGYKFVNNGIHSYIARAYDTRGNSKDSDALSVTVSILGYSKLSPGVNHSCAIATDGKAYCWGKNSTGQLGIGNLAPTESLLPVAVTMPTGVTFSQIASGNQGSCALGSDNKAYCWGGNYFGRLGNGSTTDLLVPTVVAMTNVPSGVSFSQITLLQHHACALGSDGKAYCWGNNGSGQLGSASGSSIPLTVTMPAGITFSALTNGWLHSCALSSDNKIYCWGENSSGQLGDGTTTNRNTPTPISMPAGVSGFSRVSAGPSHTCAITSDNKAYCWGQGIWGQIGNNSSSNVSTPTAVTMPIGVSFTEITAGNRHSCGLSSSNQVYCWGSNAAGQLGNGTTSQSLTPTIISMPSGITFTQLETRTDHTCAKGSDAQFYCWGDGSSGRLGNGSSVARTIPTVVNTP